MKYLVLGAGPAGLAFASRLMQRREDSFLVLEMEKEAGGLCRSSDVDGSPLDIGGGHFLDVRNQKVNEFLFQYMPESEWDRYVKDSRISLGGKMVSYPIESNIWQMGLEDQVAYLKSIALCGCNAGAEKPEDFVDWIYWKLGEKIAENYMLPYNRKMFGEELGQLGTYWLEKLPDVSFEETLRSCLTKKAYGKQPGHAMFYYPKEHGFGELWFRMADQLKNHIEYQKRVSGIDFHLKKAVCTDGSVYQAERIITTIPWMELKRLSAMPEEIRKELSGLKYSSVQIEYFPENLDTTAHWIYCPDPKLSYHRILVRHNFCRGSKGYWTETNSGRIEAKNSGRECSFSYMNRYAYPLNTLRKQEIMKLLLEWSAGQGVYGLGRWGEHQHYNSDAAVELAMRLADRLLSE